MQVLCLDWPMLPDTRRRWPELHDLGEEQPDQNRAPRWVAFHTEVHSSQEQVQPLS
jgi:hypothetical protein